MDRFQNTRQPDWDWWGRLWASPGETLRNLGLEAGDEVAEVCAGNGYFAVPAARIVEPAEVHAVDIDEELLGELEEIAEMNGVTNIHTVAADARELSHHLGVVDVVLIANTLHGVEDVPSFVREFHEILSEGGRLVVVNWHDRPRGETCIDGEPCGPPEKLRMSPEETVEAVTESAGFVETERKELPPYHYGTVFRKSDSE
jgi:ubiquinone/menaquinone biosynthesis C-methylase UbiE